MLPLFALIALLAFALQFAVAFLALLASICLVGDGGQRAAESESTGKRWSHRRNARRGILSLSSKGVTPSGHRLQCRLSSGRRLFEAITSTAGGIAAAQSVEKQLGTG
jgi:hypothetical protein